MEKFAFENQGADTYLVYHVKKDEKVDSFAKGMFQNNEIEGVLKPAFIQKDEEQYLKYNITSKVPLAEYFKDKMSRSKITAIFRSIISGLEGAEDFMLMTEGFLLDMNYIYVDISSRKANLLYLPLENPCGDGSLKKFYKSMILEIFYDEQESMDYVGRLINYLNKAREVNIRDFDKFLEKLEESESRPKAIDRSPRPQNVERVNSQPASQAPIEAAAGMQGSISSSSARMQVNQAPQSISINSPAFNQQNVAKTPSAPGRPIPLQTPPSRPISGPVGLAPNMQSPVNNGLAPTMPYQEAGTDSKKKGFALFGGNSEKKAMKAAEKAAKDAAKAAKKAAKKGGGQPAAPSGMPGVQGMPVPPVGPGGRPIPPIGPGGRPVPPAASAGGHPIPPMGPGGRPVPPVGPGGRPIPPAAPAGGHPVPPVGPGGRPIPPIAPAGGRPVPPAAPKGGHSEVQGISGQPLPPLDGQNFAQQPYQSVPPMVQQQGTYMLQPEIQKSPVMSQQASRPVHQSFMGGSSDDDENRTIIIGGADDDGSTMILDTDRAVIGSQGGRVRGVIVRRRNGQTMAINKSVFHIGKESSFADFYIGDNGTISSAHADIICDEGQYFVRDMNSLNHTYVNGILVEAGEMRELHSGDVLRLSNEEFDFKVE